jgi:putative flavoprotein involved in K+ transport
VILGEDGWPMHRRGVATSTPGLYFLGLPFLYAFASPLIGGVGRDARHIADRIASLAAVEGPSRSPGVARSRGGAIDR